MSRKASLTFKGLAIVFMLLTHFLDYRQPTNLLTPFIGSRNFDSYIGYSAGICVAMFAFINGYGLTAALEKRAGFFQKAAYILIKAIVFLLEYWVIVFSLFLPFYLTAGLPFDWQLLLRTLVGYNGLCAFAWYVWFFLIILLTIPFFSALFSKKMPWWLGLVLAYIPITLFVVISSLVDKNDQIEWLRGYLCHAISVLGGLVFYRFDLFAKGRELLSKAGLNHWWFYLVLSLLGLVTAGILRKGIVFPFALLPLLFLWTNLFDEHDLPKSVVFAFGWLGKLSMPIWFIHCLFFTQYVNQIIPIFDFVSVLRIGIAIALFALILSIPAALVYYWIFMGAKKGINALKSKAASTEDKPN